MTRLSLLLLAAIPSCVVSLSAAKWNINDPPDFDVDAKSFDFTYGGIDDSIAIANAGYKFYGYECNGTEYTSTGEFTVNTWAKDDGDKTISLDFTANPSQITQGGMYTAGTNGGVIAFCVRMGLFSGDSATGTEINFLETQVTIAVTLTGDFDVASVTVAPKDKTSTSSSQTYTVAAELCGENDTGPYNQGSVISVCVKPAGEAITDGIQMASVDSFTWTRDTTSQVAVAGGTNADALSAVAAESGTSIKVSSVLYASFYATSGSVTAAGSATMQFPQTRRLNEARRLQEIPPSPFDINADVIAATDGPSLVLETAGSASTSLYMASLIVGLVSAVLLA